jgi:hypothetical protein
LLDGITPWRDKSSYRRYARWIDAAVNGTYYVGNFTRYAKDSPIFPYDCTSALTLGGSNEAWGSATDLTPTTDHGKIANAKNTATVKALNDLASQKSTMGENLATMVQTVDSVADIATDVLEVIRALRGLRRGRLPNIKNLNVRALKRLVTDRKLEKRIANYWLAYWYGFKPLYQDAEGLIEVIQDAYVNPLLVHGRGFSTVTVTDSFDTGYLGSTKPGLHVFDSTKIQFYTTLTGKIRGNSGNIVRALNRAGLANPASLAWDLLPFSFVVDWVVPVGDTLNAFSAPIGLDFVDGSDTHRWDRDCYFTISNQYQKDGPQPQTNLYQSGFIRDKLVSFPTPSLVTKPFFKGASRWATIAALISNLTRGL